MTPETFEALKAGWQARRPFLSARGQGICPDPPAEAELAQAARAETLDDRPILLTKPALAAWRRMRAAAMAELAEPDALKLFSGYRSPAHDDERCAREQNCQGVVRAQCSAHRTGTALDLTVGYAPGFTVDSSAAENRRFQTQTPAYRWLVAHAHSFGFTNYVFEPWHWEWTGGR
jgi:LAS superfamily LD-carboxypeptidase LdcB